MTVGTLIEYLVQSFGAEVAVDFDALFLLPCEIIILKRVDDLLVDLIGSRVV